RADVPAPVLTLADRDHPAARTRRLLLGPRLRLHRSPPPAAAGRRWEERGACRSGNANEIKTSPGSRVPGAVQACTAGRGARTLLCGGPDGAGERARAGPGPGGCGSGPGLAGNAPHPALAVTLHA